MTELTSRRYCLTCDGFTEWQLDKSIQHSFCIECGSRLGVNPDNAVLKHFLNKMQNLEGFSISVSPLSDMPKLKLLQQIQAKNRQIISLRAEIQRLNTMIRKIC